MFESLTLSVDELARRCWRSGLQSTWCAKSDQQMTPAERDAHRQRIKAIQQQRDTEQAQRQQQTPRKGMASGQSSCR